MTNDARVLAVVMRKLKERSLASPLGVTDDLRAAGLTSMDMLGLVLDIEAEFDLTIPENCITPANFRNIGAINQLIDTLQAKP